MPRIAAALVAGVFALIGVTVIGFLWSQPFGQFGSPPLFFRLFGSLIASVFVIMGVSGVIVALTRKIPTPKSHFQQRMPPAPPPPKPPRAASQYDCPTCGASLAGTVDVSPSGDAKCPYCKNWFNIHTRTE